METARTVVGWALVGGFVLFFIGASAWRFAYEQPMADALRVIHADRRRRAWIHLWMIPAVFVTCAGVVATAVLLEDLTATVLAVLAATVYVIGGLCWIASLAFRLTVVTWAAEELATSDRIPEAFPALDRWAGSLYVIHMAGSYVAFGLLGAALVTAELVDPWVGWLGVGSSVVFTLGFALTRAAGFFNPPFLAHLYTAILGIVLLVG